MSRHGHRFSERTRIASFVTGMVVLSILLGIFTIEVAIILFGRIHT